jgi:hypothetical protein
LRLLDSLAWALLRALREWKLLLLLWLVNLAMGLAFAAPWLIPVLARFWNRPLAVGPPLFHPRVLLELGAILREGLGFGGGALLATMAGSVVLQSLLMGGVVARTCERQRFALGDFAAACGRMWGRMWRVELWAALWLLPIGGVAGGLAAWLHHLHEDTLFTQEAPVWLLDTPFTRVASWHLLVVLLLVSLWRTSLLLARVRVWTEDIRKTRVALWRSALQALRHPELVVLSFALWALGLRTLVAMAAVHSRLATFTDHALHAFLFAQGMLWLQGFFSVFHAAFVARWGAHFPMPGAAPKVIEPLPA